VICWNSIVEVDFSVHDSSHATMSQDTVVRIRKKDEVVDPLTELLREGAQQLISQPVTAELKVFLWRYAGRFDEAGRRAVVRNGYLPEREILTGIGAVAVSLPKERDRSGAGALLSLGAGAPECAARANRGGGAAVVASEGSVHGQHAGSARRAAG